MLEIRYTKPDVAPWIDMLFAPVWMLIALSFLSKSDIVNGFEQRTAAFWFFAIIIAFQAFIFVSGLIRTLRTPVGRLYCRIDADGLHFFDRAWYRLWKWGEVDFVPWRDIETIDPEPWAIIFAPRSWLKRFTRKVIRRIDLQPHIAYRFADKKSDEIIAAIRKAAPDIEITDGKAALPPYQ